jgi:aspartate racemase
MKIVPKHIGIVACSAEGAALCYRSICTEAPKTMGEYMHPEVTMHTYPFADYMHHIMKGNWEGVAQLMLFSLQKLLDVGAELVICPDNTIHQVFDMVVEKSPIPWLHIAQVVANKAKEEDFKHLALLGTKYLMTGPVYPAVMTKYGIICSIPDEADRDKIDSIIFNELVNGIFSTDSREIFNTIIQRQKDKGCEAVILGCTEIPLLVDPKSSPLPVLDSTRLLALAAIKAALNEK